MSRGKIKRSLRLFVSAAAISVIALLLIPVPAAHAGPFGPSCIQYGIPNRFSITQGDYRLAFSGNGGPTVNSIVWLSRRDGSTSKGQMTGSVDGTKMRFLATWEDGNAGDYFGDVDPRGNARGTTREVHRPASVAQWHSNNPLPCIKFASPPPPSAEQSQCKPGYVWRDARKGDTVCVTVGERETAKRQNSNSAQYRQPGGGANGPNTCKSGYVWRDAWNGDVVCVTPKERDEAQRQNRQQIKLN